MSATQSTIASKTAIRTLDAIVVGAGFAGLYMLHRLRSLGLNARIYEAASGPGGTWFWNRYPGARCDIPSLQYSYQFSDDLQQEWEWAERYASQSEILKYVEHVIERFKLRPDIQFNTRIQAAHFDEATGRWQVQTSTGETVSSKFCIMATGCLSSTNVPDFRGLDSFRGKFYHTGQWPHEGVDFTGQRVAVIGTGSSAVQSIPLIAAQAAQLTVFQRTANFSVPAHNAPLDPAEQKRIKANYGQLREAGKNQLLAWDIDPNAKLAADATPAEIRAECERRWRMGGLYFYGVFADLLINPESNRVLAEFIRDKIHEQVKDPAVAELLSPKGVLGCKRICADTNYFETYNRENVLLVDISKSGIDEITPQGLRVGGKDYAFDAIVFATGFDAMTGSINRVDVRGRHGQKLKDKWAAGPRTYLGLSSAGFPNFFIISGPGSPSVLTCMITSIEQHVEFITECLDYLRKNQLAHIEATVEAEDRWVEHVNEVAGSTLFNSCSSWYLGANVPGKPRIFMPYVGFPPYVAKCNEVVAKGYEGFALSA